MWGGLQEPDYTPKHGSVDEAPTKRLATRSGTCPPSPHHPEAGDAPPACSFCQKTRSQAERLIAGPHVWICNECIGLCNEILDEERIPTR